MFIDDIRVWVQAVLGSGVPCVKAPVNHRAPPRPYVTVWQNGSKSSCYAATRKSRIDGDPDNIKVEVQLHVEGFVSINAYADDGDDLLNKLKAFANMPPYKGRPIMADASDVRNLTFLDDTSHKERHECDFIFRMSYNYEVTDPAVKTLSIDGDFAGIDSAITVEITP